MRIVLRLMPFIALALLSGMVVAEERIECRCDFDSKDYSAYGTRAACTTHTVNKKSCKVAFGGMQYAPPRTAQDFPLDAEGLKITSEYLAALTAGRRELLTDPGFVSRAMYVFMRAAYLRRTDEFGETDLKALDEIVASFAQEKGPLMASVFSGKTQPQKGSWREAKYVIEKTGVIFEFGKSRLVTVYLPDAPK
jgi:hypothetical protein